MQETTDAENIEQGLPLEMWTRIFFYSDKETASLMLVNKIFYKLLQEKIIQKKKAFEEFYPEPEMRKYFAVVRTYHLATIKTYIDNIKINTFFKTKKAKKAEQFKQLNMKDRNNYTAIDYWRKRETAEAAEILFFVYHEIVKPNLKNKPEALLVATLQCKQPIAAMGNLLLPLNLTDKQFLLAAARSDHVKALEQMNPTDNDLAKLDWKKNHMLHIAISYGSMQVFNWLLKKKLDFNIANHHGATPLFQAVRKGRVEAVRLLLDKGIKPESQTIRTRRGKMRCSPLQFVLEKTQPDLSLVSLLLERGANINKANSLTGDTPLILAIERHTPTLVQLLMSKATGMPESLALKVWHPACSNRYKTADMAKYILTLFPSIDINQADGSGNTVLHCAVDASNELLVKYLLALGVDPNIKNSNGDTALMLVRTGEVAGLLLSHKQTIIDYQVNSKILWEAAKVANYSLVKVLVKYDKSLLTEDYLLRLAKQWSSMQLQCTFSSAEWLLFRQCLLAGEDPWEGVFSPMRNRYLYVINFLLNQGLDPLLKDEKGKKASRLSDVEWLIEFFQKAEKNQKKLNKATSVAKPTIAPGWMAKLKRKKENEKENDYIKQDENNNNKRVGFGKKK